ncbi:MAG: NAD(P)-dependent oxidoreductase [Anaerolineae bacterium]|nr:NAD(P)-dependent oxidoreductase [Anaerolineae bacterium]
MTAPTPEKRVLVTGGGGFVCRHIIEALLGAGYDVIALDRAFDVDLLEHWQTYWGDRVEVLMGTVDKLPSIGVDAIVHGAALTASAQEAGLSPENHLRANLDPTLEILEWAQTQNVRRTVCISSSAVYSKTAGKVTEDAPPTPDNLYAIAKSATESLVQTLRRDYGRDVITIRLSNVYGTGEISRESRPRVSLIGKLIREALTTGRMHISHPDDLRDWTFTADIGQAIVSLLDAPQLTYALYNVASEQTVTTQQLAQHIQALLPETELVINSDATPNLARQGYLSHDRLQSDTGFDSWTSLHDGLTQVIAWGREHVAQEGVR